MIVTIISYNFAGTYEDLQLKSHVIHQFTDDGKNVYVTRSISDSKFKYQVLSKNDEIKIDENGYYHYTEYNDINVIFWFLFGIGLLWSIIGIFIEDDNWEFSENWRKSIRCLVSVDLENDIYYYTALCRLLGKSDKSLTYNVLSKFNINEVRDIYLCPKFQTKRVKRNNILSKIGIN